MSRQNFQRHQGCRRCLEKRGVRSKRHGMKKVELPESPEVVVEVESPSNSVAELEGKRLLYFEKGAKEFWLCDEDGNMRFFNPQGELGRSELFGEFPKRIDIEVA